MRLLINSAIRLIVIQKEYMIVGSLHITCDWQYIASYELRAGYPAHDSQIKIPLRIMLCMNIEYFVYVFVFYSLLFMPLYPQFTVAWPLQKYYNYCVCAITRDCCFFFSFSLFLSLFHSLSSIYKLSCAFFSFLSLLLLPFSSNPSERMKK